MLPPETESVEENANEPVDTPEEEPEQGENPDGEDDWELAGEEIPGIPIPDDMVEQISEPDQESVEISEQESDQWPDGDWADPDDLAGQEIPEIPLPDDMVEVVGDHDQEPVETPEQESDQWPDEDWADPDDLAGHEIPEIPLPDDMVEIIGDHDQEPVETPEQASEQWPDGDWANPEDLAGEELNEIPLPDDIFEFPGDQDQEPVETPDQESDQWSDGDWADPEDLAGEAIYPILVPDDTFEFEDDEDQEPIENPIQEENQEKEEVLVYANSEYSSPDFLKLKSVIAEIAAQEKSQNIQKSQEIKREKREPKPELNSQKDEKEANEEINKESRETKEKDFIKNEETNEVKTEIKKEEEISSSTQNEKTQEISKELKEKYKEQTGRRPIYAGKITKGFEEWLREQQESERENQEKKEHEEIKEDWEILLEKWINDADENEISKEIKDELIEIIKKYRSVRKLEKLLMDLLAKPNHTEDEIIEIEKLIDKVNELTDNLEELFVTFERFKVFYNKNVIWSKDHITEQKIRFVKHLAQELRRLKETNNDKNTILNYNWKAFIKENVELIKDLNANDKELISKIINKADISKEERRKLISILSKLDTEQLIKIFGESFKHHTKNYIRWGWDFDRGVKRLMIKQYFENINKVSKGESFNLKGETPVRSPNNEESEAVNTFTILELFENLKRELEKIIPPEILARGGLGDSILGTLLGKSENHINYIKSQIRKYKLKGEVYQLALDLLDHYKESLKSRFGEKVINAITFIVKYNNLNVVRKSLKRIHSHHPNLILDYFKKINTKEKAYWFGFIFADGFIEVNGKRFAIELGRKDKRLLYKLAKCLKFNEDYIFYNKEHNSYVLRFQSEEFCNYLVNLGMIPGETKSKKIKLPKLDNQELYLAFLLGYFDGDGHQGTSRITSGSIKFLRQIKNRFNIKYSIDYRRSTLTLGASLLNEMLDNYKDSLLRKRIYLRVNVKAEVIDNLGIQIGEIFYTVERLSKLLWEMPLYKLTEIISQESGVEMSDRTLAKYCDKLNLHRPNSGYWHQKKFLGKFG